MSVLENKLISDEILFKHKSDNQSHSKKNYDGITSQDVQKIVNFILKENYSKFVEKTLKMKLEKKNWLLATNHYLNSLLFKGLSSLRLCNLIYKQTSNEIMLNKIYSNKVLILKIIKKNFLISKANISKSVSIFTSFKNNLNKSNAYKDFLINLVNQICINKDFNNKISSVKSIIIKNSIFCYYKKVNQKIAFKKSSISLRNYFIKQVLHSSLLFFVAFLSKKAKSSKQNFLIMNEAIKFNQVKNKQKLFFMIKKHNDKLLNEKGYYLRKTIIFRLLKKGVKNSFLFSNNKILSFSKNKSLKWRFNLHNSLKELVFIKRVFNLFQVKSKFKIFNALKNYTKLVKAQRANSTLQITKFLINYFEKVLYNNSKLALNKIKKYYLEIIKNKKTEKMMTKQKFKYKQMIFELLQTNIVISIIRNRFLKQQLKIAIKYLKANKIKKKCSNQSKLTLLFFLHNKKALILKKFYSEIVNNYYRYENKLIVAKRFEKYYSKVKSFRLLSKAVLIQKNITNKIVSFHSMMRFKKSIFELLKEHSLIIRTENYIINKSKKICLLRNFNLKKRVFHEWKKCFIVNEYIKFKLLRLKSKVFYALVYNTKYNQLL